MDWRRIAGLSLLAFGLGGAAVAAEKAELADAAEQRNGALIRKLIDAGADVNATQVDGMTALHWAVYNDDVATARMLVRAGAKVNAANRYSVPPLSLAATNGNADLVKLLLEAGADAKATLPGGETVLMTAARVGNVDAVKSLLARSADPNAREESGQTALMWAAVEGHPAVVRALIDRGADVRAKVASGFTPLFFAAREGHIDVVGALLEAGANVNETMEPANRSQDRRGIRNGTSPLLMAIVNGHFELAIALVEAGADPNDERTGFTPLHTITWVRRPDNSDGGLPPPVGSGRVTSLQFVRALVERGAKVNARLDEEAPRPPSVQTRVRSGEMTPFLMATDRADVPLMRLLLELGADPTLPNVDNATPLMVAAGLGTAAPDEEAGASEPDALEAVKILLDLGADVNAVDYYGNTAMHGAAYSNLPAVVQLLADRGAKPEVWNRPNSDEVTPLYIAEGYRYPRPIVSRPTIEAIQRLMVAKGLPTDGPRPAIRDIYEKVPASSKEPK
jgi:ankyrin repeat protein